MKPLKHTVKGKYSSDPTLTAERETSASGTPQLSLSVGHTENGKPVGGWGGFNIPDVHVPALIEWLKEAYPEA